MILGLDRHPAARCFVEIDEAVRQLRGADDVVFNAHAFPEEIPKGAVVFNLEGVGTNAVTSKSFPDNDVWDFSAVNCERWKAGGRHDVKHVPLGYHESLRRLEYVGGDRVLHFGLMNDRRNCVVQALAASGHTIDWANGIYGEPLYRLLAKCKAVVNWRYYPDGPYPSLRALLCCVNLVPVWSEPCDDAPEWVHGSAIPMMELPS